MRRKIAKISCLFLIPLIVSLVTLTIALAPSNPQTRLYVDPSSIIDTALVPGKNITIIVRVANVTDLYIWQVKLYFDPTLLSIASENLWTPPGDIFSGKPRVGLSRELGPNYVLCGDSLMGLATGVDGSAPLVGMNFSIIGTGSCALAFSRPLGADTFLWNSYLENIDSTLEDGFFSNRALPPPANIYVDPPKIIEPALTPCKNFTVNVNIANATDVYSFEFKLGFDPTILEVLDAELGSFFPPTIVPLKEINNMAGYIRFSASLVPPEPPRNGSGTLAIIEFHVKGMGACDLHLYETVLSDQTGQPLPHGTIDGFFNNALLTTLYVDPPSIIDPNLIPPATFTINITIASVENLYGYKFNLTYNTEVLTCLIVVINRVLNETNFTPRIIVDDEVGFVWVNVTYRSPAKPITTYPPAALVTLTFQIDTMGCSVLDLHDTSLVDPVGNPIPHEVNDGTVCSLIRDVAIINVTRSVTEAYAGKVVKINVTAENKGNMSETFDVKAYYDDHLIGTLAVVDLAPKENVTKVFDWNTTGVPPCHNYTVKAEAVAVPDEIDLTNNIYIDGTVKIKLPGDLNGDGKVDMLDIAIIAKAFGSWPGHPRWNPAADITEDGIVDMRDVGLAAKNFGITC